MKGNPNKFHLSYPPIRPTLKENVIDEPEIGHHKTQNLVLYRDQILDRFN